MIREGQSVAGWFREFELDFSSSSSLLLRMHRGLGVLLNVSMHNAPGATPPSTSHRIDQTTRYY